MGAMAYQITSLTIVYPTVHSGGDQRKHQSSVSLAFVRGIHRGPVNSPHKGPATRKMIPFHDVIILTSTKHKKVQIATCAAVAERLLHLTKFSTVLITFIFFFMDWIFSFLAYWWKYTIRLVQLWRSSRHSRLPHGREQQSIELPPLPAGHMHLTTCSVYVYRYNDIRICTRNDFWISCTTGNSIKSICLGKCMHFEDMGMKYIACHTANTMSCVLNSLIL